MEVINSVHFLERIKTPEPTNHASNVAPNRRSPLPSSTSLGASTVNSNIHSPSTYNSESVTLNQSLPRKPSPAPQRGGGSNLSAAAQSQINTRGAVGGQTQPSSFDNRTTNSTRTTAPQMNSAAVSSQPTQQFQPEPIGPQPSHEPSQKTQKQAQQLAAFLNKNKIPTPSTSAAPQPYSPPPLVSPTQNGQDKSGLISSAKNNSASLQSRQNNYSNRPMPSQGNCDIPDNNSFSRMPISNERLNTAPAAPSYNVTNNTALQAAPPPVRGGPPSRGRSPGQQQPFQSFGGGSAVNPMKANTVGSNSMAEATGGYNFNRIMDDHFEHYKRPASRERSVDQSNMPNALSEAPSRSFGSRPASRARTPSVSSGVTGLKTSSSRTDITLDKRLETRDDTKINGGLPNLQVSPSELTYKGPSQEIAHLGTVPKRTESMYFKPMLDEDSNVKVISIQK